MSNRFSSDKCYILNKFFESYNREINILWQRSIFLTAFITGLTVVYGKVFEKVIEIKFLSYKEFLSYSIILFFIALLGIIFSLLWIFMSKGSKYYQELYESKISVMSKKLGIDASQCSENIDEKSFFEETGVEPKIIGRIDREKVDEFMASGNYNQNKINNSFCSIKAGEYSVGRINIFIGYVFLVAWSIVANIHIFSWLVMFLKFENCNIYLGKFVEIIYCIIFSKYFLILLIICLVLCRLIIWTYHIIGKNVSSGGF